MDFKRRHRAGRLHEASFTLFETVIAVGIMAAILIELSSVQGNSILFTDRSEYGTRAVWLAKRVLSRVEYEWHQREFSELSYEGRVTPFDDYKDFSYKLQIIDWKLPIFKLLQGGAGGDESSDDANKANEQAGSEMTDLIESGMPKELANELLKVAQVEVSWAVGARNDSETIALLLTNQIGMQGELEKLKADYDAYEKKVRGKGKKKKKKDTKKKNPTTTTTTKTN